MRRKNEPKSFAQKLKDGEVFDIASASRQTGYSEQHLRRLCHRKKVSCLKRGQSYFFTPAQIVDIMKPQPARV